MTSRFLRVAIVLAAIFATSCGAAEDNADVTNGAGGESEDVLPTSPPVDDDQADDGVTASQEDTVVMGDMELPIVGTAAFTIGEYSYEFNLLSCSNTDGKLVGSGITFGIHEVTPGDVDNMPGNAEFWIQPEGSSELSGILVHAIQVHDTERDLNWSAGDPQYRVELEHSRIVEWTRDGMSATGTALFIEENQAYTQDENADFPDPEPVEATFEVACEE